MSTDSLIARTVKGRALLEGRTAKQVSLGRAQNLPYQNTAKGLLNRAMTAWALNVLVSWEQWLRRHHNAELVLVLVGRRPQGWYSMVKVDRGKKRLVAWSGGDTCAQALVNLAVDAYHKTFTWKEDDDPHIRGD